VRRRLLTVAMAAAVVVLPASAQAAGFADAFASPARQYQPKFRWWWPNALVDNAEIQAELDQMADAGFGGAEIADVHHSAKLPLDPAGHGWGTPAWTSAVQAALERAKARGMKLDLTAGPSWPSAVPSITPDSAGAIKELAYGIANVAAGATFTGAPPAPALAPTSSAVTQQKLAYVQAAKVTTAGAPPKTAYTLDGSTVVDVPIAGDGTVNWTAPADGTWLLISYWERGTGQKPEGAGHTTPDSYVIDHFSQTGTKAITDYWEQHILTPEIRSLIKDAGNTLFEDSLELETTSALWTPGFADAFQQQVGYSLLPYLPLVAKNAEKAVFNYNDATLSASVRRDINLVLTNLYDENHVKPLKAWANALGLKLRVQPYGLQTDAMQAASILDVPEGESLGFKNLDDYKREAGPRDLAGNTILSNEAGATAGGAYSTTWETELRKLAPELAAGVNQNVFHGFSYATTPESRWPGFSAFSPLNGVAGYGESWGPRQPTWKHASDVSSYFARNQEVMQTGRNTTDVGVLIQTGYVAAGYGAPYFTADTREAAQVLKDGGNHVGWTNEQISESILDLPNATVRDKHFAPDGPNFKALVLEGDVAFSRSILLRVATARKLLDWAKAGLPIVIVGNWSAPSVPGLAKPGENATLKGLIDQLLSQPTVRNPQTKDLIPPALADLGVQRDVEYPVAPLETAHRVSGDTDYYFIANSHATAAASVDATFAMTDPNAVPYFADAWTGKLVPVADYSVSGGRLKTRVSLKAGQTTILVFGHDLSALPLHATSTTADAVRADGANLVARAATPGTYTTTLSDGRSVPATIASVPAAQSLTHWTLDVDDFLPGPTPATTLHASHTLTLDGLKAWSDIPELQDVSGIGRYTTTVDWNADGGAYLDLGEVFDTYRVSVNGQALPAADQLYTTVDVGPYLKPGANTITVEVATTLLNRLRAGDVAYAGAKRQAYGLIGPVKLTPYGEATVYSRTDTPGTVGGVVPATLSLTLGAPASFGAFTPGVAKDYTASTTANVISTAGDAALSVSDPGRLANGAFSLPSPLEVSFSKAAWTAPVTNDPVTIAFGQHIGAGDALRTGSYSKTLTFTLSTTTP
jgi:hypothetical protein